MQRINGAFAEEQSCRGCQKSPLQTILRLGETPLANSLLKESELTRAERFFPLTLTLCTNCSLVQLKETVDPKEMFSDYLYFSSFSQTMLDHAQRLSERVIERFKLSSSSLVMEIASNDGYLLKNYLQKNIPVLGIEPAANVARVAQEKHKIPTECAFFNEELALKLRARGQRADIIHANNVLAHVPGINSVLRGCAALLKDEGLLITESPYLLEMIKHLEFDTIYHEHIFYYSLTAQDFLFKQAGLTIFDFDELDIHGGSLRLYAGPSQSTAHKVSDKVQKALAHEKSLKISSVEFYQDFKTRTERFKKELRALLSQLKAQGKRIAAYGASAKGSTLLNYCEVGRESLDYIVDRSTAKQGHFSPGTHLPIYDPAYLLKDRPDYVLLLTWNFQKEILEQQTAYRQGGGKFIIPIPEIVIK